jgi:hypothetical protein
MGPNATVEHHVRGLDGEALAALVADLWAARGYETSREGEFVLARHGERTVRIRVPAAADGAATPADRPADVVVAVDGHADGHEGARVVDAAGVAERLGYAVDGTVARALCERHLGAPPADLPPPPLTRARRRAEGLFGGPALAAVALVVLLGVGTAAVAFAPAGPAAETPATPSTPVVASPTPVTPDAADAGTDQQPSFPSAVDSPPPGVNGSGLVDAGALAAAHERALADRSHTIWIDWYRPRDPGPNATRIQRDVDVVAADGRYLVTTTDEVVGTGRRERLGAVYSDGTVPYGAVWNETSGSYGRVFPMDPRRDLSPTPESVRESVVERYLTTPTTGVTTRTRRDGTRVYRVTGRGPPRGGATERLANYSVVASVDARGFVRDLTAEFTRRAGNETYRVRHEVTYARLGSTTLAEPTWYERREIGGDGL